MVTVDRRQVVLGAMGMAGVLTVPMRGWSSTGGDSTGMTFQVWRKGEEIGIHELMFEMGSDGLHVTSYVDIKVKIAFVTAFSFEQRAEDLWRDNVLVHSRVQTNDDGEKSLIELAAQQNSVLIEGPNGQLEAPKGIMTDICFWNRDIVGQQRLLDTSKGEFLPLASELVGEEMLLLPGGQRLTTRYRMESQGGRSGDIWFDEAGNWVGAELTTRGETLTYKLA